MSLIFGDNCVVRSISTSEALLVMKKWTLEIQLHMPVDERTNDKVSGPFKSYDDHNENIHNMQRLASWLAYRHRNSKHVFVSVIDGNEKMMTFIEQKNTHIQVNGFLACPFIDVDTHLIARSALSLELLDIASKKDRNILFVFDI